MAETMSEIRLTLRVHTPFWLPAVTWCAVRLCSLPALFGRDVSDTQIERFGQWYAGQLRITAERS